MKKNIIIIIASILILAAAGLLIFNYFNRPDADKNLILQGKEIRSSQSEQSDNYGE